MCLSAHLEASEYYNEYCTVCTGIQIVYLYVYGFTWCCYHAPGRKAVLRPAESTELSQCKHQLLFIATTAHTDRILHDTCKSDCLQMHLLRPAIQLLGMLVCQLHQSAVDCSVRSYQYTTILL